MFVLFTYLASTPVERLGSDAGAEASGLARFHSFSATRVVISSEIRIGDNLFSQRNMNRVDFIFITSKGIPERYLEFMPILQENESRDVEKINAHRRSGQ